MRIKKMLGYLCVVTQCIFYIVIVCCLTIMSASGIQSGLTPILSICLVFCYTGFLALSLPFIYILLRMEYDAIVEGFPRVSYKTGA